MNKQKQGFTLVELIVVITILAILGTIAIMAFSGYGKNARDSARISDISRIISSVELFQVAKGFLPEPTSPTNITYSGAIAWTQGTFGDSTVTNVEKISKKPVDPLIESEYAYSITNTKKEYQIGAIYEGDSIAFSKTGLPKNGVRPVLSSLISQTYAAETGTTTKALVKGNYNGSILKVSTGGLDYVLAIPSILASDIDITDVLNIVSGKKLVFEKYNNLPASYKGTSYDINGGFEFNPVNGNIVAFSGAGGSDFLKDGAEQTIFVENLQTIYGGTNIATTPEIANILSYDTVADTAGTALLAQVLIHDYVNSNVAINSNTPVGGGESQGNSPQSNIKISQGEEFSCAIMTDKTVKCWGINYGGRLGDGTIVEKHTPVTVIGVNDAIEISSGFRHTCVIITGGTMKCWGENDRGQLGSGDILATLVAVDVQGINNATAVDMGRWYTCAILSDKSVKCWGSDDWGVLGDGVEGQQDSYIPVPVSGLSNVKTISAGAWYTTCVTLEDGTGWCWGKNESGQFGNGTFNNGGVGYAEPIQIPGINNFVDIEVGDMYACGLLSTGGVKCWGSDYGENGSIYLGNGVSDGSLIPVDVVGITNALTIDTKYRHTCVILQGGELKCWGDNYPGKLGDGTQNDALVPISNGITNASKVVVGRLGTNVLLTNGTLLYFGENDNGEAGDGTTDDPAYTHRIITGLN